MSFDSVGYYFGEKNVNYTKKGKQIFTMIEDNVQLSLVFKRKVCAMAMLTTDSEFQFAAWQSDMIRFYHEEEEAYYDDKYEYGIMEESGVFLFFAKYKVDD